MIPALVVRGDAMARVFRKLLEPEFGPELRVSSDPSDGGVIMSARSKLLRRKYVVALVTDTKPEEIRETHRSVVYLLISAGCADMWKLVLLAPETEVLLFQDRGVLRQLLGREPMEEEMTRGQTEPRNVLEEALGLEWQALDNELCRRLESVDVSPLAQHPAVQKVRDFFQAHREGRASLPF